MGTKYTILCFNYGKDVHVVLEEYRTDNFNKFMSKLFEVITIYDLIKTEIRDDD
jgi:hypothetical protein